MKIKELCKLMFEQKRKVDKMKDELKIENEALTRLKQEVLEELKNNELPNFDTGFGKVSRYKKFNAKVIDKYALAEHFKNQGVLEDMMTFNHNTVNAYMKDRIEKCKESGNIDYEVEGVDITSDFETIRITGVKL